MGRRRNHARNNGRKVNGSHVVSPSGVASPSSSTSSISPALTSPHLRSASSGADLLRRRDFAYQHGFASYDGMRNLETALGLPSDLNIKDYRRRYKRGGIAKTLVEILPRWMWSRGFSVVESEDPEIKTQFEVQVAELLGGKLNVVKRLMLADILAALGRYSVILIGVEEKGKVDLEQPLPKLRGPESVIYLRQYAEDYAPIESLEDDVGDPRYGLPKTYRLKTGKVLNGKLVSGDDKIVHWSRIIHICHDPIESDYLGEPDLQWMWNDLEALYKLAWGGSEAAWRRMDPGNAIKLDPEFDWSSDEAKQDLREKLDLVRHGLERDLIYQGAEIEPLNATVSNFNSNAHFVLELISGTRRVPVRIVLGSERGDQASTQDRHNMYDTISTRWTEFGDPLVRQFTDRMIEFGGVAAPSSGKYMIVPSEEEELAEVEKAGTVETLARANKAQWDATGEIILTPSEIRDRIYDLPPIPDLEDEITEDESDSAEQENEVEEGKEKDGRITEEDAIS